MCSSAKTNKQLTAIFLKYGIRISNQIKKNQFMPLGFGYPLSFGFGAFRASDWNIPNNCPLVLWWGDIDNPQSIVGSWYPLLPRRNNKKLYQEVCQFEDDLSVVGNANILKNVYRLSIDEYKNQRKVAKDWTYIVEHFDIHEPYRTRQASALYQYMNCLDMNVIKIIQTVIYIGRDYRNENEIEECCENFEYEEASENKSIKLKVDDPDLLLYAWIKDLIWAEGWKAKDVEIEQIYSKSLNLHIYLKRAFEILGIE